MFTRQFAINPWVNDGYLSFIKILLQQLGMGQHGFVKIPFGPFSLPTKVTHVFFVGYELVALSDSHIGKKFLYKINFTSLILFFFKK